MTKDYTQQLSLFSDEELNHLSPSRSVTYDLTPLFARLSRSAFRSRFHLTEKDKAYVRAKGLDTIRRHAEDFVVKRLAPSLIPNDGKQTPMRGHPVFLAQHATACCCRQCLYKWHHIPAGQMLTREQQQYVVDVLMTWIKWEMNRWAKHSFWKMLIIIKQ